MKTPFKLFGSLLFGTLILGGLSLSSCKDDNTNDPNAGKTDPGTIATSNLISYFSFENNGNDAIGSLTPTESPNITYVTGKRGKAIQGARNGYLLYNLPAANKLKTLKAFSIAMWFYGPPALSDTVPVPGILQIGGTSDPVWGNLCLTQDRMPDAADSLNLKIVFHKDGATWNNQFVGFSKPDFVENKWIHIIYTYDNVNSKYMVYVNGNPLTLDDGISMRYSGPDNTPLGDLVFADAQKFVIGGWMQKALGLATDEWMGWFTGKMDELRIYDKGLNATEAKALFDAEVTQLN
jgi:hypothetical protein